MTKIIDPYEYYICGNCGQGVQLKKDKSAICPKCQGVLAVVTMKVPSESNQMMAAFIAVCGFEKDWSEVTKWTWHNALATFKAGWEAGKIYQLPKNDRLAPVELAAQKVLSAFMPTDEWRDVDNTPCYESAVSDFERDKALKYLTDVLNGIKR